MKPRLPRDTSGWRIPRKGTTAKKIYNLMLDGCTPQQIAAAIGVSRVYACVVIWRLKHPDEDNLGTYILESIADFAYILSVKSEGVGHE